MNPVPNAGGRLTRTLPGRFYHDPAIWQLEQERLFARLWVCVGRGDQFPAAGHYRTVRVGDESVLVVRGEDGALRAFLNVCRHRGAQLCAAERGQARTLQCRYHAWTYGLDGRLLRAPGLQDSAEFDRSAIRARPRVPRHLGRARVAEPRGEPAAAHGAAAPSDRRPAGRCQSPHGLPDRHARGRRSIEYEVRANWKVVVENFMECYHCAPMHPELVRLLPAFRSGATQEYGLGTRLADDAESLTVSGRAPAAPFPGLPPGHERHYYGMVVRPNLLLNLLPDHVIVHTLAPLAPDRSRVTCDWLFAPDAVARPGFDPADTVALFDRVNRQDWEVCESVQVSVRSRAFSAGGVYVPIERHIRGFNDWVLEHLGASGEMGNAEGFVTPPA